MNTAKCSCFTDDVLLQSPSTCRSRPFGAGNRFERRGIGGGDGSEVERRKGKGKIRCHYRSEVSRRLRKGKSEERFDELTESGRAVERATGQRDRESRRARETAQGRERGSEESDFGKDGGAK